MNVLFLTIAYPEDQFGNNIYTDLMQEFRLQGDEVYVVCQREGIYSNTEFNMENNVNVLRVKTGKITKTNIFRKGFSILLLEKQFIKAIRQYLRQIKFDLIIYSTPPITFENVVRYFKNRDLSTTYLLLKDIFPQNAVDIGIIKHRGLIWRYFNKKEKRLYEISDYIGCMSRANVDYILKHNPTIDKRKVEVCPNSIKPSTIQNNIDRRMNTRNEYKIPLDKVVFVYGGNLGRPQGLDFLLKVLDEMKNRKDMFFLIVGSGTEYDRINKYIRDGFHHIAKLIKSLPKSEYDSLMGSCDVGLIFLDPRFTIPNFPSRLTSYMDLALPVAAATDVNTDLKDVLLESGCGLWAENGDLNGFVKIIDALSSEIEMRQAMGINGRRYLEEYYTVSKGYEIITAHLRE